MTSFSSWQIDSFPSVLRFFRILLPLIPHPPHATTVLPAGIPEAAGDPSQQPAATARSWRRTDAHRARRRHIRCWLDISKLPGTSWSIRIFRTETWLMIVLPKRAACTCKIFQNCYLQHLQSLPPRGQIFFGQNAILQICVSQPVYRLETKQFFLESSAAWLFQPKTNSPFFMLLVFKVLNKTKNYNYPLLYHVDIFPIL